MLVAKFNGLSRSCVTLTKGIQYDHEGWTSTVALNANVLVQQNELSRLQLSHSRNKKSWLHCMQGRAQAPGDWCRFALSSCSPQLLTDAIENASEIGERKRYISQHVGRGHLKFACHSACQRSSFRVKPVRSGMPACKLVFEIKRSNRLWQPTACCSMNVSSAS